MRLHSYGTALDHACRFNATLISSQWGWKLFGKIKIPLIHVGILNVKFTQMFDWDVLIYITTKLYQLCFWKGVSKRCWYCSIAQDLYCVQLQKSDVNPNLCREFADCSTEKRFMLLPILESYDAYQKELNQKEPLGQWNVVFEAKKLTKIPQFRVHLM